MEFVMLEKVKELVEKRGMRPGRAAKRINPNLSDEGVKAVHSFFEEGMMFEVSRDFFAAYSEVYSCMQKHAGMVHDYYSQDPSMRVAVLKKGNQIVARTLIRNNKYVRAYGEYHFILEGVLELEEIKKSSEALEGAYLPIIEFEEVIVTKAMRVTRLFINNREGAHQALLGPDPFEFQGLFPSNGMKYVQYIGDRMWHAVWVLTPRRIVNKREFKPYFDVPFTPPKKREGAPKPRIEKYEDAYGYLQD
jgi:hypothetical protein